MYDGKTGRDWPAQTVAWDDLHNDDDDGAWAVGAKGTRRAAGRWRSHYIR